MIDELGEILIRREKPDFLVGNRVILWLRGPDLN